MKLPVLLFFLLFIGVASHAQDSFEIKGSIIDSLSQQQLEFITVALKTDANVPSRSLITTTDGKFAFRNIKAGKYLLSVSAVGYKTNLINIELSSNKDLSAIMISQQTNALKTVVISAEKPIITHDIDKISYDLQADPESKVNSVLEMIRKVPLLSLDNDDNIQLKGSGSYKILMNGRPSSMLEKNPKDVLRSIPASTIQSIEVITNPPAKYDAEGVTGIINIVTVKKIDNGYNGNINLNHRFPAGGPGLGTGFTFKQGKLGVSANLGGSIFHDPLSSTYNTRVTTGTNASKLTQHGGRKFDVRNAYSSAQINYDIDSLNLISVQLGYNLGAFDMAGSLISSLNNATEIVEAYDLSNKTDGSRNGTDASINYQLGFKSNKRQLLTLSYRYNMFNDDRVNNVLLYNRVNYTIPDYLQMNRGTSREKTAQIDYVHPIKKLIIEAGVKRILRNNESSFNNNSRTASGAYIPDPLQSNDFENVQEVQSVYNSYQLNLKSWRFKAGVRLERTVVDADFISSGSHTEQDYFNLLPSLSVHRTFKDKSSIGFGYTQRIQRPNIWDLNPYVDRFNPNLERTGNPELQAMLGNNLQVTYSIAKKSTLSTGLSYSFSTNPVQYILLFNPATNITRITIDNVGSNRTVGWNLNITHPITPKWNFNFGSNLNYVIVTGYIDDILARNQGLKGNVTASTSYRFNKGWRVNSNVEYRLTPEIMLQGEGISILFCGFSVNKDLVKDKLSVSASVNNPFSKYQQFPNNITGTNYLHINSVRAYFRAYACSVNYRFGKLKSSITKPARSINNDDVSNGVRGLQ